MSERDDVEKLIRAIITARALLAEYVQPGHRKSLDTVDRLLEILDDREFVATLDRLNRRRIIRLVE